MRWTGRSTRSKEAGLPEHYVQIDKVSPISKILLKTHKNLRVYCVEKSIVTRSSAKWSEARHEIDTDAGSAPSGMTFLTSQSHQDSF